MFSPAALKRARPQARTGRPSSYPAPIGGWNARDALAAMQPTDAVYLRNWWPRTTDCTIRNGAADYATEFVDPVESLVTYNALDGSNEMFAVTADGIFDVTAGGEIDPEVASTTFGYWQDVNMGDQSSYYLIMVNGVDNALYYDGTDWIIVDDMSSPALTGIDTTSLIHVNVFKDRLFFIEKESLSVWYLAAGTVGGALTEFSLESKAKRGGYLMAMATWTIDGGSGLDDLAVFITSEGEVLIYQGTNPSSIATWSLIGSYYVGEPIGRRCAVKYGGDVVVVTKTGIVPLSRILQTAAIDRRIALTDKIDSVFSEAARIFGVIQGWELCVYPAEQALIVNIPTSLNTSSKQYVMNTLTKAWCEFTGWNSFCYTVFNGELYFGGINSVAKAWTGRSDFGNNIVAEAKTAFNYFGTDKLEKRMNLWRPVFRLDGELNFLVGMDVDYRDGGFLGSATYAVLDGAIWDTDLWDSGIWGSSLAVRQEWQSVDAFMGRCFASLIQVSTKTLQVEWIANDYLLDHGGIL
jgi:hypothetical protein